MASLKAWLNDSRLKTAVLWSLRLLAGGVFIVSGWAKCVDLYGTCLKISEYLTAMGMDLQPELVLIGATGLSTLEFVTGIMLATGCLRRVAVWTAAGFMAVMLPLTLWIAIAKPVSHCGCFGDLFVVSNTATFFKNVGLSVVVVLLWIYNRRRTGLYPAPIQWLVIVASWAYPLYIGYVGYQTQPLVDFRPFKIGVELLGDAGEGPKALFIYERDGHAQPFTLENLPDSTWKFVHIEETLGDEDGLLTVYTPDGNDVTFDLAETLRETPRALLLVVSEPEAQFLTRAHYLQELRDYLAAGGVEMYAFVGAYGDSFDRWVRLTRPNFPAYEAEDTSLKMLVRGSAGVVYLRNGRIVWKSTLGALSPDLPGSEDNAAEVMDSIKPIDSGASMLWITGIYLAGMLVVYGLGLSPKVLRLLRRMAGGDKKVCES
ncbi:MAG: DoxX family protein [Muribaculaceae bacterium]|nr:DoxX family protein [Muribaculaceae bacterium]